MTSGGSGIGGTSVTKYDAQAFVYVMDRLAEGMTIVEALKGEGLPSRATFYRWLALYPELSKAYEAARELSAQSFEEEALEMARTLKGDNAFTGVKVRMYEVAMAQLRWSAARRDPKRFGSKQEVGLIVPIQINTSLDMGGGSSSINLGSAPGKTIGPDDVYNLEAIVGDPEDTGLAAEDAFMVPDNPLDVLPRGKPGRPRGPSTKGHKTPAQLRATLAAKARRKNKDVE